jgi:glutamine amidotransferase-like uncharacterized protein
LDIETFPVAVQTFRDLQFFPVTVKGIAYIEAAASVKNIKQKISIQFCQMLWVL